MSSVRVIMSQLTPLCWYSNTPFHQEKARGRNLSIHELIKGEEKYLELAENLVIFEKYFIFGNLMTWKKI